MLRLLWQLAAVALILALGVRVRLVKAKKTKGVAWVFWSNLAEVLVIFVGAGGLFLAVASWAEWTDQPDATLGVLWRLEARLAALHAFTNRWALPSKLGAVLLAILAVWGYVGKRWLPERIYHWFERTKKLWKRCGLLATALASFSLFSGTVPSAHARIEVRIKSTEERYATYARELEVASTVISRYHALEHAHASLPAEWRKAVEQESELVSRALDLRRRLVALQRYLADEPRPSAPARSPLRADSTPPPDDPSVARDEPVSAREMDPDASETSLSALRDELAVRVQSLKTRAVDFFASSLGSKLPEEAVGEILSSEHVPGLAELCEAEPLLKPFLELLDEAVREAVKPRLKALIAKFRKKPARGAAREFERESAAATAPVDWASVREPVGRVQTETSEALRDVRVASVECDAVEQHALTVLRDEWSALRQPRLELGVSPTTKSRVAAPLPAASASPAAAEVAAAFQALDLDAEADAAIAQLVEAFRAANFEQRAQLISEARPAVEGASTYGEKIDELERVSREFERKRKLAQARAEEKRLGLPEGRLSSRYETPEESTARRAREKAAQAEQLERIKDELARERAILRQVEERASGEEIRVNLKIGDFEIHEIPLRMLIPRE